MPKTLLAEDAGVRLARDLRVAVAAGSLAPETRLAPLRTLAEQYGITYARAQRVVKRLAREGMLVMRQGEGTFVAPRAGAGGLAGATGAVPSAAQVALITMRDFHSQTEGPWMVDMVRGFDAAMRERGAAFDVLFLDDMRSSLAEGGATAGALDAARTIFMFGTPLPSWLEPELRRRARAGAQVVLLDAAPEHAEWATVINVDGAAGMSAAVELLRRAGHERIAMASWDVLHEEGRTAWWIVEREDAYREAMHSAGLDPVTWRVPFAAVLERRGTLVERLGPGGAAAFADAGRRPTAIVCVNDLVARAVAEACTSPDAAAGGPPALTGFDDEPWAVGFGLTTFQRPFRQLATLIAEMAVQSRVPGRFRCRGLLAAEPVLVERKSTPPPGA